MLVYQRVMLVKQCHQLSCNPTRKNSWCIASPTYKNDQFGVVDDIALLNQPLAVCLCDHLVLQSVCFAAWNGGIVLF